MTPLMSAETGEGAAGCASGSHTCSGTSPAFAPKPKRASKKATARPVGSEMRAAHGLKGELPAATLHDPEAEQNGDSPDVRDQQVEKPGACGSREARAEW